MEPEKIDALKQFLFAAERLELLFGMPITDQQSEWVKSLLKSRDIPPQHASQWLIDRQLQPEGNQEDLLKEALYAFAAIELGAEL